MATEIIDETRVFIILHKHGEPSKTLRPPLVPNGVYQMLNETYAEHPTARVEVLTIELEKSEGDLYHIYKSGVDLYPTIKDGREYLKGYTPAEPVAKESPVIQKVKKPKKTKD